MIVITRQIRAARSLLGWEQHELAHQAGVAISTIRRLEGSKSPVHVNVQTIGKITAACERAGITFIGLPDPGVQLRCEATEATAQPVVVGDMRLSDRVAEQR